MTQEDCDTSLARITTTTELRDLAACDLVVEAIFENFEAKKAVFEELDLLLRPKALLASNTSSIDITRWPPSPNGPTALSACTSSTPSRSCRS